MNCRADIESLADSKMKSAHILLNSGMYDDSYYIGGYAIELLLKARVCKILDIDHFFGDAFLKKLKTPQAYKIHDLNQLLILSGLYAEHDTESKRPDFKLHWSIVTCWSEVHRYLTGKSEQHAKDLLTSIDEISKWIKSHL